MDWMDDLAGALDRGRRERKAVLLYFGKDPWPECARLEAGAFADPRVREEVATRFVAVKQLLGRDREPMRRYRPFWTPTLYFLEPDGNAVAEWPGVIAPEELLALLDFGEAQVGLRRGRFKDAIALLERVVEERPDSATAPEALYWLGNARFVAERDQVALDAARAELTRRYPESAAARRV